MAIQLTSTKVVSAQQGIKCLVYGDAGTGKTVLSSTCPTPVIISAEAGLLSLRNFDIPVIEIKTLEDLEDAYQWATESSEAKGFETVCLDSISEIAEVVLNERKRNCKDPRAAYGETNERMATTIRSFRDLFGKHVYLSAKKEYMKDDVTGTQKYMPSMPGKSLTTSLPYFFDEVFCLQIGQGQKEDNSTFDYRYLQTNPNLQYHAKDRSGCLNDMEEPHLGKIFDKIINGTTQEQH